jgi:hypothetical protein
VAEHDAAVDYLMTLVTCAVEARGYRWTSVSPDQLELTDAAGNQIPLGLTTLRRVAGFKDTDDWPAVVADYVGTTLVAVETHIESPVDFADFDTMAPLLRTRLYTTNFDQLESYIVRPVAPGLAQMVVLDFPISVVLPTHSLAADWPMRHEDLFALAHDNTRGDTMLDVEWADERNNAVEPDDGGVRIATLSGADEYASAHALWLDQYPVTGTAGALFTVPAEGIVQAHPLDTTDAGMPAAFRLAILADALYEQLRHRISPHVYLWRDGRIQLAANTSMVNNQVVLQFTDDVMAAFGSLGDSPFPF